MIELFDLKRGWGMGAKPSDPTLVFRENDWLLGKGKVLQELIQTELRLYPKAANIHCMISRANRDSEGDKLCTTTD